MFGPANHHTKRRVIPHVATSIPTRGVALSYVKGWCSHNNKESTAPQ